MKNLFNFIFLGKRALDTWALNLATTVATETAFELIARESPELFKELHFKLMGKKTGENFEADIAKTQRDWELGKIEIIANYIGEKKLNSLREEIAEVITRFLTK